MQIWSQLQSVNRERGRQLGPWRRRGPGLYQSYALAPCHEFAFVARFAANNRVNHLVGQRMKDFEGLVEFGTDEDFIGAVIAVGAVPALSDSVLAAGHALRPTAGYGQRGCLNAGNKLRAMRSMALRSHASRVGSSSTGVIHDAHDISLL